MSNNPHYEMYTPAGNRACERLVQRLRKRVLEFDTADKLMAAVRAGAEAVARKHGEVFDSEPRWHIYKKALLPIASFHGYEKEVDHYF